MNKYATMIKEFNETFDLQDGKLYGKLIREEFNEWFDEFENKESPERELKELCDLLYVVYGYAHFKDWIIEKSNKEIEEILGKAEIYMSKYSEMNIMGSIIGTAYLEFIVSKDYIWLERLAQAIFAYAKYKGWPMEQAFKRVHDSNMSKLEDGQVLRREDGKVMKGRDYKPAVLSDLVKKPKLVKKKAS